MGLWCEIFMSFLRKQWVRSAPTKVECTRVDRSIDCQRKRCNRPIRRAPSGSTELAVTVVSLWKSSISGSFGPRGLCHCFYRHPRYAHRSATSLPRLTHDGCGIEHLPYAGFTPRRFVANDNRIPFTLFTLTFNV